MGGVEGYAIKEIFGDWARCPECGNHLFIQDMDWNNHSKRIRCCGSSCTLGRQDYGGKVYPPGTPNSEILNDLLEILEEDSSGRLTV